MAAAALGHSGKKSLLSGKALILIIKIMIMCKVKFIPIAAHKLYNVQPSCSLSTVHVPRPDIDEVAGGLKTDADKGKGKNNASSLEDHCPPSLKRCSAYNCGMQLCILPTSSSSQVTELETPRC